MSKIRILDRETKANFEIRVINKETQKSRSISIYAEDETEDTLREKFKEFLEGDPN